MHSGNLWQHQHHNNINGGTYIIAPLGTVYAKFITMSLLLSKRQRMSKYKNAQRLVCYLHLFEEQQRHRQQSQWVWTIKNNAVLCLRWIYSCRSFICDPLPCVQVRSASLPSIPAAECFIARRTTPDALKLQSSSSSASFAWGKCIPNTYVIFYSYPVHIYSDPALCRR